jgi:hypothetical protein
MTTARTRWTDEEDRSTLYSDDLVIGYVVKRGDYQFTSHSIDGPIGRHAYRAAAKERVEEHIKQQGITR